MFGVLKNKTTGHDHELFTIFDTKTGSYDIPSFAINEHDMVRAITNLFRGNDRYQNRLYQNAEDFQLFRVGTYDKKTGNLTGLQPEHVANLHDIKSMVDRDLMQQMPAMRDATPSQVNQ